MLSGKKHSIIILFVIMLNITLWAQTPFNFAQVDSTSFALYEQQQWKELKQFCTPALFNQFDYYYLRMRAGIACFERKAYREAELHFKKALLLNKEDETAKSYLKSVYAYTNKIEESLSLKPNSSKRFVSTIQLLNTNFEIGLKTTPKLYIDNAYFSSFGLMHSFGKKASFFHALNYYFQTEERFNVQQAQYYLRYNIALKHQFKLQFAAHYVFNLFELKNYLAFEPQGFTHPPPPFIYTLSAIPNDAPTYTTVTLPSQKGQSYIGSLNVIKQFKKIDLNLGTTISKLDTIQQYQVNAGINTYPFSNNDFQVGIQATTHFNNHNKDIYFALAPQLITKVYKGLYFQLSYFMNQELNIVEQNGYFINNSVDLTKQRLGFSPSYIVNSKFTLYANYLLESKEHEPDQSTYNYHLYLLGVKFNY